MYVCLAKTNSKIETRIHRSFALSGRVAFHSSPCLSPAATNYLTSPSDRVRTKRCNLEIQCVGETGPQGPSKLSAMFVRDPRRWLLSSGGEINCVFKLASFTVSSFS